MPIGGEEVRGHVGVPVSLLISEQPTREQPASTHKYFVGAQDLSHLGGGEDVPLDGEMGGTVWVLDTAGPSVR